MRQTVLIAHNLRSTHNVGSLLRTAEGLAVDKVYLTGYTPYPLTSRDSRLPYIADKLSRQINKTALGAEKLVKWRHETDIFKVLNKLKAQKVTVAALEQSRGSINLTKFHSPDNIVIVVGNEVDGLEASVLAACDLVLAIPMSGRKESFNVVQAAAMALYHLKYL